MQSAETHTEQQQVQRQAPNAPKKVKRANSFMIDRGIEYNHNNYFDFDDYEEGKGDEDITQAQAKTEAQAQAKTDEMAGAGTGKKLDDSIVETIEMKWLNTYNQKHIPFKDRVFDSCPIPDTCTCRKIYNWYTPDVCTCTDEMKLDGKMVCASCHTTQRRSCHRNCGCQLLPVYSTGYLYLE